MSAYVGSIQNLKGLYVESKTSSSSPEKRPAPKPPSQRSLTSATANTLVENEGGHLAEQSGQKAQEALRQSCSSQSEILNESLDEEPVQFKSTFVEDWPINDTHLSPPNKIPLDLSELLVSINGHSRDVLTHPLPANKRKAEKNTKNGIFQRMPKQHWWRLQPCTR